MKRRALIDYRADRSQVEMATMYGVTQQAWSQWEIGRTKPPLHIMKAISVDSGKPMEELFFDKFNTDSLSGNAGADTLNNEAV